MGHILVTGLILGLCPLNCRPFELRSQALRGVLRIDFMDVFFQKRNFSMDAVSTGNLVSKQELILFGLTASFLETELSMNLKERLPSALLPRWIIPPDFRSLAVFSLVKLLV